MIDIHKSYNYMLDVYWLLDGYMHASNHETEQYQDIIEYLCGK